MKVLLALFIVTSAFAQVNTTTIVGPVYDPFGNPYSGSFTVQSQAKTNTGWAITGTKRTVVVQGGVIQAFSLVPNDTSTPNLTSYLVTFANSDTWTCLVPTVTLPVTTTVTTTISSTSATVASALSLAVGQLVSAAGVPSNATIAAVSGTTITLSLAATATASGVAATFYTTIPFTQACAPNAMPPNTATPFSVSQLIPSSTNGSVLATINGTAAWTSGSLLPPGTSGQVLTSNGAGGFGTPLNASQAGAASSLVETDSNGYASSYGQFFYDGLGKAYSLYPNPTSTNQLIFQGGSSNAGTLIGLHPTGTGNFSNVAVTNSSDLVNYGQLVTQVSGTAANIWVGENGTGTEPTTLNIGELAGQGAGLQSINFEFNGVNQASISTSGLLSTIGGFSYAPTSSTGWTIGGFGLLKSSLAYEPVTASSNGVIEVYPNTTGATAGGGYKVYNTTAANAQSANYGVLYLQVRGAAANLLTLTSGSGTPITSLNLGEAGPSTSVLQSINFQFEGVTKGGINVGGVFLETPYTPSSSSASCTVGQFADDANYHYVCTGPTQWKRVALSTF